jgi:formimidoylglutamate deiminase
MVVLNDHTPGLLGVPPSHTLDALVFGCDTPAVRDVFVAGQAVIHEGQHARQAPVAAQFVAAMDALWHGAVLE